VPCEGMSGIIREGQAVIGDGATGPVRDAALIGAAQRVEHYETAVYGTLIAWASAMGHDEVVTLLKDSLEEEKNADATLSKLAETGINEAALSAEGADMASSHPGGKASGRGKHSSRRASGQARGDQ